MPAELTTVLSASAYPGRGIVMGLEPSAGHLYMAYFIMGRSENSRNRVFVQKDSALVTQPADPAKVTDPSLIIYAPVRSLGQMTIVTNGDQTDTIYGTLRAGGTFEDALNTRTFEPDAPNFTPRISAMATLGFEGFSYQMSILKSAGGGSSVQRFFYHYPQPLKGCGHFIHTYGGEGDPLPSFKGEPVSVTVNGGLEAFGEALWASLNEENKVSLFVRSISLDGEEETRLFNKYTQL